jgi:uncharacterized protein (DUF2249 family)
MAMIPTETVPVELECARSMSELCGAALLRRFDTLRPLQAFVLVTGDDPTPLLKHLQEERHGLFEWSSLQAGPSTWRIEIARRAEGADEAFQITDAIEWDHDRLHRLERTAFDAWAAGDSGAAEAAFALFAHGLRRHIGFEEALLFPEFERRNRADPDSGPTGNLRTEHREILAVVAAIELAMRSDAVPLHLLRRHLQELLLAHSRYEERLLYPAADQMFSPAERDDLIRRVQLFHGG